MDLTKLPGIGPGKAKLLLALGVTNTGQLTDPRFIRYLPEVTILNLKYNICKEIPRDIITIFLSLLPDGFIPVGSWKRCAEYSSDIDILCVIDQIESLDVATEYIRDIGTQYNIYKVLELYDCGVAKCSLLVKFISNELFVEDELIVQIDLFATTRANLPFAIFHYTGSKEFNIRTRAEAKRRGYVLNQYGLFRASDKQKIILNTERDIFEYIGITWLEPCDRN